ncbi:hypothetical protein KP509_09G079300 [Ceratopteris richardii]|uniref:Uncharacterized protein n=1 Tax=Ceratopteris richardii TaxID=49495 RepID=A0A8T2U5R7_CERRI|nr:hypothetical protein KP509_09G079300 [Ceratopteris richardii]
MAVHMKHQACTWACLSWISTRICCAAFEGKRLNPEQSFKLSV